MNEYDSEKNVVRPRRRTRRHRTGTQPDDADIILFNTCSVREKAQEKVFSDLGRVRPLKEKNPDLIIGVAGALPLKKAKTSSKRAPYVDVVFGPANAAPPAQTHRRQRNHRPISNRYFLPRIEKFDHLPPAHVEGGSAFISIMEGCSKYCSYCVVPYTRGEEFSRPLNDVLTEIAGLAQQGVKKSTS